MAQPTLTKLKQKLLEDVKKLIRESGPCVVKVKGGVSRACGGVMQASHIFPVGAYPNLAHDPENMLPKCATHHLWWWHKDPVAAGVWFGKNFPEKQKYLRSMKKTHFDWSPEKVAILRRATKKGLPAYCEAYNKLKPKP